MSYYDELSAVEELEKTLPTGFSLVDTDEEEEFEEDDDEEEEFNEDEEDDI